MKFKSLFFLFFLLNGISCTQKELSNDIIYPNITKETVIDTIRGTALIDLYRNLEDLKNEAVITWFEKEGDLTDSILKVIRPENSIYKEILDIENKSIDSEIIETYRYTDNGEYYILKRDKDEGIAKLYYKKNKTSKEVLILDPKDVGENLAINFFKSSPNNEKIAIALSPKGSDVSNVIIFDCKSGKTLPNKLTNVIPDFVGGINWLSDSSGFYYLRFPHLNPQDPTYLENSKAYIHYLGTSEDRDIEVFSIAKTPEIALTSADFPIVQTRKENPTIILGRISGNTPYKDMYYSNVTTKKSLEKPNWQSLFKQADQIDQYFIVQDTLFYRTSKNAPNFKICKALIGSDYNKGTVLVKELKNDVITDFEILHNDIYYTKAKNGVSAELVYLSKNKSHTIKLPYDSGFCYIRSIKDDLLVSISGWTKPLQSYLFSTKRKVFNPIDEFKKKNYPKIFNNLIIEEVEVISHDGTKVPLSIIRHPDTKLDGTARIKINAYGSYGDSSVPYLQISYLNWVTSGNIFAMAHIRGGGEKGDAWHKGGFKTTKANSWKDFIACTEYLIDQKYTNPDRTIAIGVSAGGIAIANALIERPDLYQVGQIYSGFINATRSEFQPNGANSKKEFGALAIPEEAQGLIDMDAYLKIKKDGAYPAIYAFVGLEDGAVAAWDSGKFVAKLQNDTKTLNPVLLEVDIDGNHGGGGTLHDTYQILSNMDAFALWQTGHPDYQPEKVEKVEK